MVERMTMITCITIGVILVTMLCNSYSSNIPRWLNLGHVHFRYVVMGAAIPAGIILFFTYRRYMHAIKEEGAAPAS